MRAAREDSLVHAGVTPIPDGWRFIPDGNNLHLAVRKNGATRYQIIYDLFGFTFALPPLLAFDQPSREPRWLSVFVGPIAEDPKMADAASPVLIQMVAKLSYKYGAACSEWGNSFVLVRNSAFRSKACLEKSFESVSLGTPIKGIVDLTDIEYGSAQLAGRHSYRD